MEKEYAHAIIEAAKRGVKPHDIAHNLKASLNTRGHMTLVPRIARALKTEEARLRRTSESVLHVAKESESSAASAEARAFAGNSPMRILTDDSLIGGWKLITPNTRIDASFKKQLLDLYRKITA